MPYFQTLSHYINIFVTFVWNSNTRNGQDLEGTGKGFFLSLNLFLVPLWHITPNHPPAIAPGKFYNDGRTFMHRLT